MKIIIDCISKEEVKAVVKKHKKILDKLAEIDEDRGKAEYDTECAAAQSLIEAEDEAKWQEERWADDERLAEEHSGSEGDEGDE